MNGILFLISLSRPDSGFRRDSPLQRVPHLLCGLLLFVYTLSFVYRVVISLLYSYPLEYGESAIFYEVGQLYNHGFAPDNLYPTNINPPYQAGVYSPLFYYLNALAMFVTGSQSMLGGRLITLVAALYIGFSLYSIARKQELAAGRKAGLGIGLAAALTPFATAALYTWGVLAKPDTLAFAFGLAAVQHLQQADSQRRRDSNPRPYMMVGLLCALALLTKQSAVAAPLAILIWLGLERRWQDLGAFLGMMLGTLGTIGLALHFITGGTYFKHIINYNSQPLSFEVLTAALAYLVGTHFILLILAGFWLFRPLVGRFERTDIWRIYFVTALLVSLFLAKIGSEFDNYIESLCLIALLGWWQAGRVLAMRSNLRLADFQIPLSLIVMSLMAVQMLQLHPPDNIYTPTSADFDTSAQVAAYVKELAAQGPILAEDSGWQAALGLSVDLDDPFVFGQIGPTGLWDSRPFLEKLNRGYYRYIFFESVGDTPTAGRFDPKVLQTITDPAKFAPLKRIGRWVFLQSKT